MQVNSGAVLSLLKRLRRPRYAALALALVLLMLLVVWLAPRRMTGIVAVDGSQGWPDRVAPPQRRIVWAPPARLEDFVPAESAPGALGNPQLTDGGATLYFSLRSAAGDADIYRSRLMDGKWQPAVPMAELNSSADDLGLFIRPDGSELYLSSSRPGGRGGMDLYVSRRTSAGFSAPENLGSQVNTPANEYEPALTPDGLRLVFASDRSHRVRRGNQVGAAGSKAAKAKVAAPAGVPAAPLSDLFVTGRTSADREWQDPVALAAFNRPDANERAPCVSPDGAFLYFASDRPFKSGRQRNYDLYRARWTADAAKAQAENLGPEVNTQANETEPAFSPEGFTLWFVSDRPGSSAARREFGSGGDLAADEAALARPLPPPAGLYRSTAVEVERQVAWDTSHAQALAAIWWKALLATLLFAGLLALVYRLCGWLFETASMPRFFVASLLFHAVVLWLMLVVPLSQEIFERVEEIRVSQADVQMFDDNLHQSHEAGQEAYEKVADLESVEQVSVSEIARQATAPQNVTVRNERLAPTIRAELARTLPPQRVVFVPPPRQESPPATIELGRRAPANPLQVADPEPLEVQPPPAAPTPTESALDAQEMDVARADSQSPPARLFKPPPRDLDMTVEPAELDPPLTEQRLANQPSAAPSPRDVRRAPVPLAAEQLSTESEMPTIAGQPLVERPLPMVEATLSRAPQSQPSPRKIETPPPRVASTRMAGPPAPVETDEPGTASARAAAAPEREARTVVSPPAEEPEEVQLVAAIETPGLPGVTAEPVAMAIERSDAAGPEPARRPPSDPDRLTGVGLPPSDEARQRLRPEDVAPETAPRATAVQVARTDPARSIAVEPVAGDPVAMPAAVESPQVAPLERAATELARADGAALELAVQTPDETTGPRNPLVAETVIGSLAEEAVEAPPSLSPHATQLARKPARATPVAYAEDNVGMQAMFALRQGDVRREFIDLFGGNDQTEAAVSLGLKWLADHQHQDGRWSLNQLDPPEKNLPASTGPGNVASDTAATGLGLLPFLGSGHTHTSGDYQPTVGNALQWIVTNQKPDGDLFVGASSNAHMYSHGIAAIALCEAYGLSQDPALAEPAQRAVNFIVAVQHQGTGGWRYTPGEAGDTSVVGWQVMALKSGEMAGLTVPPATLELANKWLNSAEAGPAAGTFGYQGPGGSPAMTAEGLLCRQFLGARRDDTGMQSGARFLLANLPQPGVETSYYWYYGTQVMYHMQGDYWTAWNERLRDTVVATQIKDGHLAGTWDPQDQWESSGGRIYATSLRLLMLQVYYRHLPLYRQLDD